MLSVVQEQALGTADALRAAQAHIDHDASVVVLAGDVPLIMPETIASLARAQHETGAAATILTAIFEDPTGYGRVVRAADGTVEKVVETKRPEDATPDGARDQRDQRRHIRLCRRGAAAGAGAGRQQQRPGRVLPPGRAAAAPYAGPPGDSARASRRRADARGQRSRAAGRGQNRGPAPDQRGADARRRDDHRPRPHRDRRRGRARARHA